MRKTRVGSIITAGLLSSLCGLPAMPAAWASTSVASGCAAPIVKSGHSTFYVDPIRGSMSGDGSLTHPWHTLAEVLDFRNQLVANAAPTYVAGSGYIRPKSDAPIKSGDVVLLMNGNHGSAFLQGSFGTSQLTGYDNTDFITIAAAPGQTPIVKQLVLKGVNKWAFQGLTFESLQDVPANKGQPFSNKVAGLDDYYLVNMLGPNSNVLFSNNTFQSQANTSSWSVSDWISKRVSGLTAIGGSCLSITNNKLQNIGFALSSQRGTNVLIKQNVIDHFTDDGVDYGSNNMVIDHNQITNSINDGDGFHQDGMQGQPYGNIPVSNVQITNNVVVNQTEALVSPANLQGIDTFDGVWQNVVVENNVVITNAYHGITYYGVTNLAIINNTVIGTSTGLGSGISTWIDVNPSKSGTASQNVVVRNNIATLVIVTAASATVDHNMVATMNPNYIKYFKPSQGVGAAMLTTSVFKTFDASKYQYDPRLLNSKAVAGGLRALAPPTDIRGASRGNGETVDLGALVYGGLAVSAQLPSNVITASNK